MNEYGECFLGSRHSCALPSHRNHLIHHTPCTLRSGGKKIKKKERDEILGELMTGGAGMKQQPQHAGATPAGGKSRAGVMVSVISG